ncbi:MAG: hypothetical protein KAW12_06170 [Candidatus Aminicenantes bacterium]|nr:hypothetical protein [Candidatus Aminicenantes bacterium]
MPTLEKITLSEFQDLLGHVKFPAETRLTVTFEDNKSALEILKKKQAVAAMRRLRGSGNGKLVAALLKEREQKTGKNLCTPN